MEIVLNFASLAVVFLCLDQPMVINTIPMIFIKGCSKAVSRMAALLISLKPAFPSGETK